MKRNHLIRLAVAMVILLLAGPPAMSQTVELPLFVIKDSNGAVIGPIIESNSSVVVGLRNSNNQEPFILQFNDERFRNPRVLDVYYTNANCTGTPYIEDPADSSQTLVQMRKSAYVAASSNFPLSAEPDIVVTNKFAAGTGSDHSAMLNSRYRVGTVNAVPTCDGTVTSADTIEAEVARDLSALAPPYKLE